MKKKIRGEKRTGHFPVGPLGGDITIEQFLVRVFLVVKALRIPPDVNIASMGNGPEQRRFAGAVFPYKKSDGRPETKTSGFSEDLLVKGIVVFGRVFFRVKHYFLEMHDKIP
jgi:hypothetical protein